ncbi:hypothetical protein TBLA_0E02520 [Henningerozyma blattae CBS 6284]|uniref:Major facilitator superfamily (MFS) profile domain-containing protein n=1 Tax=Henningerozyma blattae (strain ATCC 34711 / CBS 6284 / DSM 70876 / NBRC 10599 / NRRL Y-10934 / UCD 77-7) TaxID=1071380 RepID=I2H4K4_HENB6|nr:hypothetical protein TBLA_0E02520 [Tetrapisispora blattae CBS 6284]CCH61306.1 hypothetical protein TBLA_0E02520 [Tetrapisispora blattae CBS 6284]
MSYKENFKNSFFFDVLEYMNWVQFEEYPVNEQEVPSAASTCSNNSNKNLILDEGEDNKSDISTEVEKDLEKNSCIQNCDSMAESSLKGKEGTEFDPFLVDWHGPDDPENPLNWKPWKKGLIMFEVMLLTSINYMGSSIYTPGQEEIQREFHVGHVVATLNLSMYVLGYGIGPMILSPLSEYARFGRLHIYIISMFLFTIFQIGAATVHNIGGLIVIRFISGILCSPALATGGGTLADFLDPKTLPRYIGLWSLGFMSAPVSAPLLGACMVVAKDWRWIFWLLLFMSVALFVMLIFFFPETHHGNILHRRAQRLRKETGDDRYYTLQIREEANLTLGPFLKKCLLKPFKLIIQEPIILSFDLYLAVCYGIFYLFFEAFPLVFVGIYNFTLIELGLSYLGFCVGCVFAYPIFLTFFNKFITPKFANNTFTPEHFMVLSKYICWFLPLALFFFGWTAKVHWILPIISEMFFVIGVFNLFQTLFSYLALCYTEHLSSVYAGNGFFRSIFASAFPLFGQAMFNNLGTKNYPVAWGSSLLGFIAIGLTLIPIVIYKYGGYLRSKSSFSG